MYIIITASPQTICSVYTAGGGVAKRLYLPYSFHTLRTSERRQGQNNFIKIIVSKMSFVQRFQYNDFFLSFLVLAQQHSYAIEVIISKAVYPRRWWLSSACTTRLTTIATRISTKLCVTLQNFTEFSHYMYAAHDLKLHTQPTLCIQVCRSWSRR